MNFLHLKYLIEVEKYESISKAAQHLYINQPRLSKIIKEIEEEANIKIFERHNKGVVPTTKGREFLSQAKKIVQEVDYLKNIKTKIRYINPLINQNEKYVRIDQISEKSKQDINKCLNFKTKEYLYFDFNF